MKCKTPTIEGPSADWFCLFESGHMTSDSEEDEYARRVRQKPEKLRVTDIPICHHMPAGTGHL